MFLSALLSLYLVSGVSAHPLRSLFAFAAVVQATLLRGRYEIQSGIVHMESYA